MTSAETQLPSRLAEFEVIRRLGTGGMAEVFLARKRGAERTFKLLVVKRILPQHVSSRQFRAMFADEAQLATRLNHPNIVQVYDFLDSGEEGQLLSMEYVEGTDLRGLQRAARSKGLRIPPYVACYIASEIAKGLHYAHERRDEGGRPLEIVHRDVSPQNILLSFDGSVKIADFGIATANVFREEAGVLKGKTGYMSPEQARGEKVDRRTDIYSLGVVLYEMLSNRPLHGSREGDELLEAVRAGIVEPPSTYATGIPSEVEAITLRALQKEPDARFENARDMASALARLLVQKQQLVDSHVVETTISEIFDRTSTPTKEAMASERPVAEDDPLRSSEPVRGGPDDPLLSSRPLREKAGREVRHVAVVTLRVHHLAALRQEIGESRAHRLVDQLRATLSEIAYKRGCHWVWTGDESDDAVSLVARAVVGLTAHAAHASTDAAWLAVDCHEAISGACDDLQVALQASIGIVRGIASGQRDFEGHLVRHVLHKPADELSALIGQHASAGETWVAGGLFRLVRRDFVWRDAPNIEIVDADARNLPRNVRVHVLVRPLTRQEKLEQLASTPRDLVGRDSELAELHAAYHRATSTQTATRGTVTCRVIMGEMGIGKTALVDAFLTELPKQARVVRIDCSPAGRELPLSHIGQWLRELTGIQLDTPYADARRAIVAALGDPDSSSRAGEIVNRMTDLATNRVVEAFDEADVSHQRKLATSGVRRFFGRASLEGPLVAVLEGIQWCDLPSLEILTALAKQADPSPILVLLVARPDERIAPLLEGMVHIELKGLHTEHQLRLVQAHLGANKGVAEVCADLLPRAGGNPFFLLEMVDTLLERGALDLRENEHHEQVLLRVGHAPEALAPLPSTLEQLIADRLNELPLPERTIIEWLAVAGAPLSLSDLRALSEIEIEEHVARLCARGLCDAREEFVEVRHPLSRDVAYLALERGERARMHNAFAQHLSQTPLASGLSAALIARHFARGGNREAAGESYLRAAMAARKSYQLDIATRFLRRVIAVLPAGDPRTVDALEVLESNCRIQGRPRDRRRHLNALRTLALGSGKPGWVALALARSARLDLDEGRLSQGLQIAQQAEQMARLANAPHLEVEAQRLVTEMLRELGDTQGALSACDRALETAAHHFPSPSLTAEMLRARGMLLLRVGRVNEAISAHAEAIGVFHLTGRKRLESRAKNSLAVAMFVMGHYSDAIALALEAVRIDVAIGGRFQIGRTLSIIGQSYARLGDYDRAENYLWRARDAHQRYGDHDGRADTLLASAELSLARGELDRAETLTNESLGLSSTTGSAYDAVHEKLLRALLALARGRPSAAVMHAFDARQVAEVQAYVSFHFYAMAIEAVARVELGEQHTGILLATTALGALETLQGSEYGLETRALCCDALARAGSPQATTLKRRASVYAKQLLEQITDVDLRSKFASRPPVALLLEREPATRSGH